MPVLDNDSNIYNNEFYKGGFGNSPGRSIEDIGKNRWGQ